MGPATSTVKYILLLFNLLCSLLGLILMGFGIFVLTSSASIAVDHGENLAGGLIIALGAIVFMIALFGCCGAMRESRGMILTYVILLVVLLLVQLIMMSMATQGTNDGLSASVREGFESLWKDEVKTPGMLAFYEDWLQCCGVNSTSDYHDISRNIPKTCCKQHNCSKAENINNFGCQLKFEEYLAGKMVTFTVISWILVLVELLGIVCGVMLLNSWKNYSRRSRGGWN